MPLVLTQNQPANALDPYTELGIVGSEMTNQSNDVRAEFHLAAALEGSGAPSQIARVLCMADVGIYSVGDVQRHTLGDLRALMSRADITEDDQVVFLSQMRDSNVFPSDVKTYRDFTLR